MKGHGDAHMEKMNIERHIDSLIHETLDEVALYLQDQHEKNIYREKEYGPFSFKSSNGRGI